MPNEQPTPGILFLNPLSYIKPTYLVSINPFIWEITGCSVDHPHRSGLDYLISIMEAKREMIDEDSIVVLTTIFREGALVDKNVTELPPGDSEALFEVVQRQYGGFEYHEREVLSLKGVKLGEEATFLYTSWEKSIFDGRLRQNYPIS